MADEEQKEEPKVFFVQPHNAVFEIEFNWKFVDPDKESQEEE